MVTVQHLVKQELEKNLLLLDMIQQDLLNINALALKLHPSIEAQLSKTVKLSAVSMAIRRVSQQFLHKKLFSWKFPSDLEISTKTGIYEVAIKREPHLPKLLNKIGLKLNNQPSTFLSVVDASYETVLFTNQYNQKILKASLNSKNILCERDNLGYVSINFEQTTKDISGIYYQITRALALRNISIQSMHTLGAEVILLFKNDVLIPAYHTLKALIENKPIL